MNDMTPGAHISLTLTDVASHGPAVGRHAEQVVFVDYGIPGEEVVAEVERVKRRFANGRVAEVRAPSPDRVEPACPYFGTCGGCQWQHIAYERQVELKRQIVVGQLRKIGHFEDPPVAPMVPAPEPYGYRNHIRLTIKDGQLGYISRPGDGYR